MKIKRERAESVGVFALVLSATAGITLTSLNSGAQSTSYFAVVIFAFLIGLGLFWLNLRIRFLWIPFTGISLLTLIFIAQALAYQAGQHQYDFATAGYSSLAVGLIIVISGALATVKDLPFRYALMTAWAAHMAILLYGFVEGGARTIQIGTERFSGAGFREVIWAEIALGTLVLAIMSRSRLCIALSLPLVGFIIIATQMRTVGLAALVSLVIVSYQHFYAEGNRSTKRFTLFAFIGLSVLVVSFLQEDLVRLVSAMLLLDNEHRGISSGFSGRFDNISEGWNLFLEAPLIGVGATQQDAAYVHNGYIKVLAQYGVFGIFWIAILFCALWRSLRQRDYSMLAAIVTLSVYYVGQPRHLSFQVFPLAGVIAVFRIIAQSDATKAVSVHRSRFG